MPGCIGTCSWGSLHSPSSTKLHYTFIRQCLIDLFPGPHKLQKGRSVAGLLPCCPCCPALTEVMGRLRAEAFIDLTATSSVHPRGAQKWETVPTPPVAEQLTRYHRSKASLQRQGKCPVQARSPCLLTLNEAPLDGTHLESRNSVFLFKDPPPSVPVPVTPLFCAENLRTWR